MKAPTLMLSVLALTIGLTTGLSGVALDGPSEANLGRPGAIAHGLSHRITGTVGRPIAGAAANATAVISTGFRNAPQIVCEASDFMSAAPWADSIDRIAAFSAGQNYPNPSNRGTWIPFRLASEADVTIGVFDVRGRLVRTLRLGVRPAGEYSSVERAAYWDGMDNAGELAPSGIYFYVLKAGGFQAKRKMIILRDGS